MHCDVRWLQKQKTALFLHQGAKKPERRRAFAQRILKEDRQCAYDRRRQLGRADAVKAAGGTVLLNRHVGAISVRLQVLSDAKSSYR